MIRLLISLILPGGLPSSSWKRVAAAGWCIAMGTVALAIGTIFWPGVR